MIIGSLWHDWPLLILKVSILFSGEDSGATIKIIEKEIEVIINFVTVHMP